ncbi:armadillo-type protein [Roridomyces roridus]|uniref:Armadillo-type protein n=1 Tax=Roridomyces roridus TaxID=1738132 RepID=A0AAD7C177_9AGAR|nr:armadillo-type protein [Roridomyces roridus]
MSLSRQPSVPSLLSYWSDSSPAPASIRLHTLAKPLQKYLYRQQAVGFIKGDWVRKLDREMMEVYRSYLTYKDAGTQTKAVVLNFLISKAYSEIDVDEVTFSLTEEPDLLPSLLAHPAARIRRRTCELVTAMALQEFGVDALLGSGVFSALTAVLRDDAARVAASALVALAALSNHPDGAQSVVQTRILGFLATLLESPDAQIRSSTCMMLGNIAQHASTLSAVVAAGSCRHLVSLLRDADRTVAARASFVVEKICHSPEGAQAALDSGLLHVIPDSLGSHELPSTDEPTAAIPGVIQNGLFVLRNLSAATVDAGVLSFFDSPHTKIRSLTCSKTGTIAQHSSTLGTVGASSPRNRLTSLLRDTDEKDVTTAFFAACQLSNTRDGRGQQTAALDTHILNFIPELLHSPNVDVRTSIAYMLSSMASHESTSGILLTATPTTYRLVLLLRDNEPDVMRNTLFALENICKQPAGAQAVADARLVNWMPDLLGSLDSQIRATTCRLVARMARYDGTRTLVQYLVPLLRDAEEDVVEEAAMALDCVFEQDEGSVQAALDVEIMHTIREALSESPSANVQRMMARLTNQISGGIV